MRQGYSDFSKIYDYKLRAYFNERIRGLSHVLQAMKLSENVLRSAIRFSFGLGNTTQEMEYTAQKIGTILKRLRK